MSGDVRFATRLLLSMFLQIRTGVRRGSSAAT